MFFLLAFLMSLLAYYIVYRRSFYRELKISFFDFIFNTRKCQIAFKRHVTSIIADSFKKLEIKTPENMWPETLSSNDHAEIH
jgi:hypothetical protein